MTYWEVLVLNPSFCPDGERANRRTPDGAARTGKEAGRWPKHLACPAHCALDRPECATSGAGPDTQNETGSEVDGGKPARWSRSLHRGRTKPRLAAVDAFPAPEGLSCDGPRSGRPALPPGYAEALRTVVNKGNGGGKPYGFDHTSTNAPDPIRTPQLSVLGRE